MMERNSNRHKVRSLVGVKWIDAVDKQSLYGKGLLGSSQLPGCTGGGEIGRAILDVATLRVGKESATIEKESPELHNY